MRRLLIDNLNLVINAIELDEGSDWAPPEGQALLPPGTAGRIGDTWDGTQCVAPAPSPERRREVDKMLIVDRLQAAGLFDAAMAALGTPQSYLYERWSAARFIYSDDQVVRGLLTGIGADPDAILARE